MKNATVKATATTTTAFTFSDSVKEVFADAGKTLTAKEDFAMNRAGKALQAAGKLAGMELKAESKKISEEKRKALLEEIRLFKKDNAVLLQEAAAVKKQSPEFQTIAQIFDNEMNAVIDEALVKSLLQSASKGDKSAINTLLQKVIADVKNTIADCPELTDRDVVAKQSMNYAHMKGYNDGHVSTTKAFINSFIAGIGQKGVRRAGENAALKNLCGFIQYCIVNGGQKLSTGNGQYTGEKDA